MLLLFLVWLLVGLAGSWLYLRWCLEDTGRIDIGNVSVAFFVLLLSPVLPMIVTIQYLVDTGQDEKFFRTVVYKDQNMKRTR